MKRIDLHIANAYSLNVRRISGRMFLLVWVAAAAAVHAQSAKEITAQVRAYRSQNEVAIVRQLADFVAIPNVASDRENIGKNADLLISMLQRRGITAKTLEVPGAPPYVYGELAAPSATRTIGFYAHYDGQPVDPSQWATSPWTPVLRDKPLENGGQEIPLATLRSPINGEARLYARSTSDDKAPIIAMLAAIDALQSTKIPRSVNLKFIFDSEEEAGSPHLEEAFRRNTDLLKADAWLLCDAPVHQSGHMELFFGARGLAGLEMTVYGPTRALHSGHYGNWAPNPAVLLVQLLATMRDADGKIHIAGFSDDVRPLSPEDEKALAAIPPVEQQLRDELGLAWSEGNGQSLARLIAQPGLNIRGIQSGHVGEQAQNAIPTEAKASIDFRLVPDQTVEKVRALVEAHIQRQGFFVVHNAPDIATRKQHPRVVWLEWTSGGYPAARIAIDSPFSRAVITTTEDALGAPVVKLPILGGSVPMYLFVDLLHAPVLGLPIVNADNNQHAANENLRIQNLWDGMEVFAGLMARMGLVWQ